MKKHLGLLGVTLLSAAVFAHAKPVQAIAGPGFMEHLQPAQTKSSIIVNVDARVEGTSELKYIRSFEFDVNEEIITKDSLLKAIEKQLAITGYWDKRYVVVGFDGDAVLTNRLGQQYIAPEDGSVHLNLNDIQYYLLKGHVIIKPYVEPTITKSAEKVDVHHEVTFKFLDGSSSDIYASENLGIKKIGETILSSTLEESAKKLLQEKNSDYVILERKSAGVTHDEGKDYTYLTPTEYTYSIKDREFIRKISDKAGTGTENSNTDSIGETYLIVHKNQAQNYQNRSEEQLEVVNVNYIDADNNHLLVQTYLGINDLSDIDFMDGYDRMNKHRILVNNLDYYNILGYTITGRVDHFVLDGQRRVNVYMIKRPDGLRASDHYGYDNGSSLEDKEQYAYLRELEKTEPQINPEVMSTSSSDKLIPGPSQEK